MNKKWWKESVVYQVYPRSFKDSNGDGIGDLNGMIEKLDYIKSLGIDVIWICPMYKSPNDDNGYDISDYQDIMDEFGTMEDFERLLEEVHKREMKLILDLVVNHTSDEHAWFIESRSSKDNPKRDWYIWRDGRNGGNEYEPNNWESIFSGNAWKFDETTGQYFLHLFSEKQPDLNWENKKVRNAVIDMINWWLDKGIDGFRVDAISHIKKTPGLPDVDNPGLLRSVPAYQHMLNVDGIGEFLSELSDQTFKKYDVMTVGEANGVRIEEADQWVGEEKGYFNMIFQFEHLGLWEKNTETGVNVTELKKTLTKWQKGLEGRGWNALFLENHDQPRSVSTWGNDTLFHEKSAKALAVMYFFMQGTPYIYQGQEIGMTNVKFDSIHDYNDVGMKNYYRIERENGRPHHEIMEVIWKKGRDNSRTPMQWNDSFQAGFTTSEKTWFGVNPNYKEINVEKQERDPYSILNFYKKMIRIRKENEVLIYGNYDLILENDPNVYAYTRTLENEKVVVFVNLASWETKVALPDYNKYKKELLLENYYVDNHDLSNFVLKPFEARIYKLK